MRNLAMLLALFGVVSCGDSTGSGPTALNGPNPIGLTATDAGIELTWAPLSNSGASIQIERKVGEAGGFGLIATLPAATARFLDDTPDLGSQYCYRARAIAGAQQSAYSNTACGAALIPALGGWIERTVMPTARMEMFATTLGGEVYVAGGFNAAGAPMATLEIYDAARSVWRTGTPMPEPRHHHGLAAVSGRVYVVGGFIGAFPVWQGTRDVFEYNPANSLWTRRANMPEPRGAHATVAVDGKIYVIGGQRAQADHSLPASVLIYDPASNEWRTGASMRVAREHLTAAAVGNRIYAIGGRITADEQRFSETTTNLAAVEAYDVVTDTWQTLQPIPTPRGGLFSAAHNGRIYAFGGEFPGVYGAVEEYNPQTNTWRQMAPMREPRHAAATATVGDTIFTIGGGAQFGFAEARTNHGFLPPK